MNNLKLAGWLIILSVLVFFTGSFVAPPGAYEGTDLPKRLAVIAENQAQWHISKVFDGLAIVIPAIAFLLLASSLWNQQARWPLVGGAGAFIVTALLGIIYVYQLAVIPGSTWERGFPEPLSFTLAMVFLAGEVLLGLTFLKGNFPTWLGYFTSAMGILGLILAIIFRTLSPFLVFSLIYLLNLVPGIMLVRGAKRNI